MAYKTLKEALLKSLEEIDSGTATEVYQRIVEKNYFEFSGKTPVDTVQSRLGDFIRQGDARVKRVKDGSKAYRYYLAKNEDTMESFPIFNEPTGKKESQPIDQIEAAFDTINKDLATELLKKVLGQSPKFFENLVLNLLVKMGYGGSSKGAAEVTRYSHDDGIDGIISEDKLGLDKIYIQAKRFTKGNVGKPQIQQFSGALDEKKANKGVFITTSSYSKEARDYVGKTNHKIILIDGEELARYMIEYNVGVSVKQVYEVKRIDSDYFEE
ncbi:MAG: restriction endonuclease [Prevotella sp.]|nr:restriction endonuclease [Prevotella sp.]